MSLKTIIEYMTDSAWLVEPGMLEQFCHIVERHIAGDKLTDDEIAAATGGRAGAQEKYSFEITADGTAIIPVRGVIAKYSHMVNGASQPRGTSLEQLSRQLSEARTDARVNRIFLLIESPGGSVAGLADFADQVYATSFEKPVVAFADDMAASAAYWIGSQANVFYGNATAAIGSIGVYTLFVDSSARAAQMGLKFIIVRSGANKGIGSPGVQVSDENIAAVQERIDGLYEMFLSAVLRGRAGAGLSAEGLAPLADGRVFLGGEAAAGKLIDGVMPLAEALAAEAPAVRDSEYTAAEAADAAEQTEDTDVVETERNVIMAKEQTEAVGVEAAIAAERQRTAAINEALAGPEFDALRKKALAGGMTVDAAKAEAFELSQQSRETESSQLKEKLAERDTRLAAIATDGVDDLVAAPDESAAVEGGQLVDDGEAATFEAAIDHFVSKGMKRGKGTSQAVAKFPKSYEAAHEAQPTRELND